MNERDFCLWLQGFAELNTQPPTPEQWQSIREHLQTVFKKVTPVLQAIERQYRQQGLGGPNTHFKPYDNPMLDPLLDPLEKPIVMR